MTFDYSNLYAYLSPNYKYCSKNWEKLLAAAKMHATVKTQSNDIYEYLVENKEINDSSRGGGKTFSSRAYCRNCILSVSTGEHLSWRAVFLSTSISWIYNSQPKPFRPTLGCWESWVIMLRCSWYGRELRYDIHHVTCSCAVVFVSKHMKNGTNCDLNNLNAARTLCGYRSWVEVRSKVKTKTRKSQKLFKNFRATLETWAHIFSVIR